MSDDLKQDILRAENNSSSGDESSDENNTVVNFGDPLILKHSDDGGEQIKNLFGNSNSLKEHKSANDSKQKVNESKYGRSDKK